MPIDNALTPGGQNALGAAFGYYPQLLRQGQRARQLAQARDVNTLPDPRTYAAAQAFLGTAPDQLGFSVMHPDYQGIRNVADPAYALGLAAGVAPFTKGLPVGMSIKSVAPQEEALRLAQQRAALPPSKGGLGLPANNTAQQRAAAMEFNQPMFHETEGANIDKGLLNFDPRRVGAAASDEQTPYAMFLKPHPVGIGIARNNPAQMPVLVKTNLSDQNILQGFQNRDELQQYLNQFPEIKKSTQAVRDLDRQMANYMGEIEKKADALEAQGKRKEADKLLDSLNFDSKLMKEFDARNNELAAIAKEKITDLFKSKGIGTVALTNDAGAFGRSTITEMVLNPADNVRSRFAAFDPWRKTAATAAAFGVAAPDLLAAESQNDINQVRKLKANKDTLSATPRNQLLGSLADLAAASYAPQRTQQMQGVAQFLGAPAVAQTLDRLSYGEPLTTGAGGLGGTTRVRPEAIEAAMAVAPLAQPATMATLQAARAARQAALAGGRAGERYAERVIPQIMERGGMPAEMLQGLAQGSRSQALPTPGRSGFGAFDPRYDPRVKEQERLQSMVRDIQLNPNAQNAPAVSLADFEGRPFITSMADRTAAGGNLMGIDNVKFNRPVELLGGQDYMFNNPGQVWASAQGPVKQLMKQAAEIKQATGQDPLYMPWRMAPTGGDFAAMTGETMLAYADSAMGKMQKKSLDRSIKKMIPDWSGVSDPASVQQFRNAPDKVRKAIKDMMDVDFREKGGLNIGGARLAVSDPAQMVGQDAGVMNVGEIFAGRPMIMESGHPSYPRGVPGQGLGTLVEDRNIFELMPEVAQARGIPDPKKPRTTDIRALQMKPYSGVITNDLLKRLGY